MIPAMVVCASAVVCLLVAEAYGSAIAKIASKMSAASAFVAMALACGALQSVYGQMLLVGLALCWVGDACLLSSGRSIGFLAGIAAFLLAHLAYAIAFYQLGLDCVGLLAGAIGMAVFDVFAFRWLRPHVPGDFRIPIFSYIAVISIMVIASIGAVAHGAPILLGVGAIGFAISDLFVARARFVKTGFVNAGIGLPSYFGSQMLLAHSATYAIPTM